jgi:hypothetical protein
VSELICTSVGWRRVIDAQGSTWRRVGWKAVVGATVGAVMTLAGVWLAQGSQVAERSLRANLKTFVNGAGTDPSLRTKMEDWVNELEAFVAPAEAEASDARAEALRKAVHRVAVQFAVQTSPAEAIEPRAGALKAVAIPEEFSVFVVQIKRELGGIQARMKGVADPIFAGIRAREASAPDPKIQASVVEAATANLSDATFDREIAEMTLAEYEELVAKRDLANAQEELKLAELDLARAKELNQLAQECAGKIKPAGKDAPKEVVDAREFREGALVLSAQFDEFKASYGIERARLRLLVSNKLERFDREQELKKGVERARSVERAKKGLLQQEEAKLKTMQGGTRKPELSVLERRLLGLLDRAIPIDAAIRGALEQLTKAGRLDVALEKSIQDRVNQLNVVIDQAEADANEGEQNALLNAILRASALYPTSKR